MPTINIELPVDAEELWLQLFGCGYESDPVNRNWLMNTEFAQGSDWNKMGVATIWYIPEGKDYDNEKYWGKNYKKHCASKVVTISEIATALSKAMSEGYNHVPCGGKIDTDFDRWDSCVGDILLQLICYGKEVYA
jgi:hypothetical protein